MRTWPLTYLSIAMVNAHTDCYGFYTLAAATHQGNVSKSECNNKCPGDYKKKARHRRKSKRSTTIMFADYAKVTLNNTYMQMSHA